jgi:NADPH:quinone reductase
LQTSCSDRVYHGGPKPPFSPGFEASGVVEATGPGVTSVHPGLRVSIVASQGLLADRAVVNARNCILLPETIPDDEGAAFPVQYLTAYHSLVTVAKAAAGETVLIHAAAGGLGTAAIQVAKLLGLVVIGTASTEKKRQYALEVGADIATSYESFDVEVLGVTNKEGPEIILETIGGEIFRRSIAILPPLGRLIVLGITSMQPRPVDTSKLLFGSYAVMGFHLNSLLGNQDLLHDSIHKVITWITDGKLKVRIGHVLPLAEIGKAHELLESRESCGKIILLP